MKVRGLAALDEFEQNQKTGRFMLMDGYNDEEIAVRLNLPQPNISYYHKQIREKATNLGISRF